jgi:hypothetical protein
VVASDSLLEPDGRFDRRVLWPRLSETKVLDKIDAYLAEGYRRGADLATAAERDAYATEWAYWRGFDNVHQRVLVNPSTIGLGGQGNASWLLTQIQDIERQAIRARDAAEAILVGTVADPTPVTRQSACVPTIFGLTADVSDT